MSQPRIRVLAAMLALTPALAGCGPTVVPAYDGPPHPQAEIAIVEIEIFATARGSHSLALEKIDGNSPPGSSLEAVSLLPGSHVLNVRHSLKRPNSGSTLDVHYLETENGMKIEIRELTSACLTTIESDFDLTIPFQAAAGHRYGLNAQSKSLDKADYSIWLEDRTAGKTVWRHRCLGQDCQTSPTGGSLPPATATAQACQKDTECSADLICSAGKCQADDAPPPSPSAPRSYTHMAALKHDLGQGIISQEEFQRHQAELKRKRQKELLEAKRRYSAGQLNRSQYRALVTAIKTKYETGR